MKRVSIFLITLVLIVGTVGCGPTPTVEYSLTMAVAPDGSGTATDLTDASPYTAGTSVNIEAVATAGYEFVNWSAPAGTFVDANAAQTTFTMPAQNVTVTANFSPFPGGSGTEGDPYQIMDWHDLDEVRNYLDSCFILMNDLDSTTPGYTEGAGPTANGGKGWQPIGGIEITNTSPVEFELIDPFTGEFDGHGSEIRNLLINRPDEDAVALFGSVAGGVMNDVEVLDADITGGMGVGILVGASLGSVSISCSSGTVGGYAGVGGLIGGNIGEVSDSHSSASVNGANNATGGLTGLNAGNVVRSYADGNVSGNHEVGGLVGYNEGDVSYSHACGSVDGGSYVGGVVGQTGNGSVSYSYAVGNVSGAYFVGGLAGQTYYDPVSYCYATGSVSGYQYVGGLLGNTHYATVSDSYATGSVSGYQYVGGLLGNTHYGTVSHSYSTGSVSGLDEFGGLVGVNNGTVSNSFWDTETSGQSTSDGGIGKSTAEMQDIDTFSSATWDIIGVIDASTRNLSYIWNIVDDETYPFLSWEPVS